MANWDWLAGKNWPRPVQLNRRVERGRADDSEGGILKLLCLVLLVVAMAAVPSYSQRITASLSGVVRDPSNAVIPGAIVQVTNSGTNSTTRVKTNIDGRFVVTSLPPGSYRLTVDAPGFKRLLRSGLILVVDQTAELDLTMQLGSATQSVSVTGEQPLLDTGNAELGQIITNKSIVNLPLNQRNPFSLILLSTGVTGNVGSNFTGLQFNVDGGRSGTTDVLLDGIPSAPPTDDFNALTIFPSVDAVQEFKVQTSNYSAEFGLTGGGIINVVYKSGSNELHGSAYDFLRNSALDSNNFFSNKNGVPLASFKRNQFGFSLGGPVVIPKLYHGRNKTFFFADYEGLRQLEGTTTITTVPTVAERTGDFSQDTTSSGKPITIYDPTTTSLVGSTYVRQPFAKNIIPANRIDSVAANVEKYWPLPNKPGINGTQVDNYVVAAPAPYDIDQGDIKVDQIISPRQHLSIRYSQRNPVSYAAITMPPADVIAQRGGNFPEPAKSGDLEYTFTVSPSDLIEFRYGLANVDFEEQALGEGFNPTQLGFPSYLAADANALAFPGFEPSGYMGIGSGSQLSQGSLDMVTNSWAITNTKILSHHTLNFGVNARVLANYTNQVGRSTGDFSFGTNFTQGPNALASSSTAGDGFASFLLGLGGGDVTHNFKIIDTVSEYYAPYIQDDWKATGKLTLNLGLRYDLFIPRTEHHDRESFFDASAPSPLAGPSGFQNLRGGLIYPGGVNGSRVFDTFYRGFAPRFGFAFHPAKRLVFRGGYGIFFTDTPTEAAATVSPTGYRTDSTFYGTLNGVTPYAYLSNPYPTGFVPVTGNSQGLLTSTGQSVSSPFPYEPTPYMEDWNVDVQYQLPRNWRVDAAYVGSHGVDLAESQTLNQLPISDLSLGSKLLQSVPNPFYGLITNSGPLAEPTVNKEYLMTPYPQFTGVSPGYVVGADSLYDSMQLRAEKLFSKNLMLLVSYTAAKMMDNYSSNNTSNFNGSGTSEDAYNQRLDWSLSTADISQSMVASFVYTLPYGRGQHFGASSSRFADTLFGGWQFNGIVTEQTGLPLALSAANVAGIFSPGERPDTNGQNPRLTGSVESRLTRYFNTADFSQPAPFTLGDVSRTLSNIRAPGVHNFDLSLFKDFPITERLTLQFRAESFNAFNKPQFGGPNGAVNSSAFGVISSQVNSPRQTQFALKLLW